MKVPGGGAGGHCTACLTGNYPGGLPDNLDWWFCFWEWESFVILNMVLYKTLLIFLKFLIYFMRYSHTILFL